MMVVFLGFPGTGWASQEFNATEVSDAVIYGASSSQRLGFSVATGDVDDDGLDDWFLGTYASGAGNAYLFLSTSTHSGEIYLATQTADVTFTGTGDYDDFGASLAIDDWNDDGSDDVIIGSAGADYKSASNCGVVYVFYGGGFVPGTEMDPQNADVTIVGAASGDGFGSAMDSGLFNSDGYADLFAVSDFGHGGDGSAYVINGANDTPGTVIQVSLSSRVQIKLYNAYAYDGVGETIGAADINGDGLYDMISGIPFTGPTFLNAFRGRVSVVFGGNSVRTIDQGTQNPDLSFWGANDNDSVGEAVAGGDLNGDGIDDLIFQANSEKGREEDPGLVYVMNGRDDWTIGSQYIMSSVTPNVKILGEEDYDAFGEALAVGQFDGIGPMDLLIGAYSHSNNPAFSQEGAVYVLLGCNSWSSGHVIAAGASSSIVARIYGGSDSRCGYSLVCGNFDNNPGCDLLIGAPIGDLGSNYFVGRSFVLMHQSMFPVTSVGAHWLLYE